MIISIYSRYYVNKKIKKYISRMNSLKRKILCVQHNLKLRIRNTKM